MASHSIKREAERRMAELEEGAINRGFTPEEQDEYEALRSFVGGEDAHNGTEIVIRWEDGVWVALADNRVAPGYGLERGKAAEGDTLLELLSNLTKIVTDAAPR